MAKGLHPWSEKLVCVDGTDRTGQVLESQCSHGVLPQVSKIASCGRCCWHRPHLCVWLLLDEESGDTAALPDRPITAGRLGLSQFSRAFFAVDKFLMPWLWQTKISSESKLLGLDAT